jgi:superfamily II DNA/RNA helicase
MGVVSGAGVGVKVVSVVGGEQIEAQGAALREGCHVVVATPGRLKDCLERRFAVLQQVGEKTPLNVFSKPQNDSL